MMVAVGVMIGARRMTEIMQNRADAQHAEQQHQQSREHIDSVEKPGGMEKSAGRMKQTLHGMEIARERPVVKTRAAMQGSGVGINL